MNNKNLSDMEIKLYNASREFVNKVIKKEVGNAILKMSDFSGDITSIEISARRQFQEHSYTVLSVEYFKNFMGKGDELIRIDGEFAERYEKSLIKKIAGIKHKIEKRD